MITPHKQAHIFDFFWNKGPLLFKAVAPNDGLKASSLHRTGHHVGRHLQGWQSYRSITFSAYITGYWTLLQMAMILSTENRHKVGQWSQCTKAVLMKYVGILRTILIPSCLLATLQMRSLRAGKELNAGFSSWDQDEVRKTVATTVPCYIFWDTEGFVIKRSRLCPWPRPNVGYCSSCSCCYYSQRPMWKNYCPITLFLPGACSFKGSLASFLWKKKNVALSIFPWRAELSPEWRQQNLHDKSLNKFLQGGCKRDSNETVFLCRWERIGTYSLLSSFENKSLFRYTLAFIGIWIRKSLGREGQCGVEPFISPDEKNSQLWWQYIRFQTWALKTSGNNLESFCILLIINGKATSFQWCWTERKVK